MCLCQLKQIAVSIEVECLLRIVVEMLSSMLDKTVENALLVVEMSDQWSECWSTY